MIQMEKRLFAALLQGFPGGSELNPTRSPTLILATPATNAGCPKVSPRELH
jgi:hypothetical protein